MEKDTGTDTVGHVHISMENSLNFSILLAPKPNSI